MGVLLAFVWQRNVPNVTAFSCDLLFVSLLVVITGVDWDFQVILDSSVYLGIAGGLLCALLHHQLLDSIFAALAGLLFFYAIRVIGEFVFLREAMGEGDVKLAAMLGAFLGLKKLGIAVVLSFPIGVVIALGLMALGLKSRKDYIPFGPAMCLGGFVAAFWGDDLLRWYLGMSFG